MYRTFAEIEADVLRNRWSLRIALAASHDPHALEAVVTARRKGVASACLIGDAAATRALLEVMGESPEGYTIIDEPSGPAAARLACRMVHAGEADAPMKGALHTADFMRAIQEREFGFLAEGGILSQATVFEASEPDRLMILSDCAVNIAPGYSAKLKITRNAVALARQLGIECPKVALLAPVETVNPAIQATVDAALISKAAQRGQLEHCLVDGPLALDNAVSAEAARSKNIPGEVAGHADILIMPDLCTGNALTKSIHYFARLRQTGSLTGSRVPIIMTSRTDTVEDKYFSVLVALLQSNQKVGDVT